MNLKVTKHNGKFDFEELTEETTSCEWCEAELSFEVVWHSFGSSFVDKAMFCPNCGRRLED
jgi:hypothetical protein